MEIFDPSRQASAPRIAVVHYVERWTDHNRNSRQIRIASQAIYYRWSADKDLSTEDMLFGRSVREIRVMITWDAQ